MKKLSTMIFGCLTLSAAFSAAAQWPPETGAKVPGNALEYPTRLSAVNDSLEHMLNQGAAVITTSPGTDGPMVTIKKGKHYIICVLKGAGTGADQNVATSKCYQMN